MAAPGVELIVGLRRDPQFGPAVVVGLGGILTEVLDDVAIRLAPVDARERAGDARRAARARACSTASAAGRRSIAARSSAMLVALGRARASSGPTSLEVDLNPVIASPTGALAVDALVVLEGRPDGRLTADDSVLLPPATPWGVRLTLNRPAKLNALVGRARPGAGGRARRGRGRPGRPGHRHRGRRPGLLVGLRPDRGGRGRRSTGRSPGASCWPPTSPRPSASSTARSRSSPRSTATPWPAAWSWRWPATWSSPPRAPSSASPRSATARRRSRC